MKTSTKIRILPVLFIIMTFFPVASVLAQSDKQIQLEIEAQIAESAVLQDIRIDIHVEQRLVVLTGEVRLYEQKMSLERIAWTTPEVFEVDNEILIVPQMPLSDEQIKEKIRMIVKADDHFHVALLDIRVDKGNVYLKGSFLDFRDPSRLKHKVAAIEGVLAIRINATFLVTPVKMNEVVQENKVSDPTIKL